MATTDEFTDLITSNHADKPKFMATVYTGALYAAGGINFLASLPEAFSLNTAIGAQLDAVGLRIGRSRQVQVDLTGYFSWDIDGLGWDEGVWQGPFDPDTGTSLLDDGSYRLLLKARALANGWDGSVEQMRAIYAQLFAGQPYSVRVVDNQNMTVTVYVLGPEPDPRTKALIVGNYLGLKPAGVAVSYVFAALFPATVLVQPGAAGSAGGNTFTFARTSPAAYDDATGNYVEVGNNVARFRGPTLFLLLEGQRQNRATNPRAEGATTGLPATWGGSATAVTRTIIGTATRNGVQGFVIRYASVPTATGPQTIAFDTAETVAAGTTYSVSLVTELIAGTMTNVSQFGLRVGAEASTLFTPGALQRTLNTRTLTGTNSQAMVRWNYIDTVTAVDFTIFVGWATRELAPFASSPILPPVGSPAMATRSEDLARWAMLPTFSDVGAIFAKVLMPASTSTQDRYIFSMDDGTGNNVLAIKCPAGTANLVAEMISGGVSQGTLALGSHIAGTLFSVMLSWFRGAIKALGPSGAVQSASITLPVGLSRLTGGDNFNGTLSLFGEAAALQALPYQPTDAESQTRIAAL